MDRGRPSLLWDRLLHPKVDESTGCWIWPGALNKSGHGYGWYRGRNQEAHRISYRYFVGEPEGLVCHKCNNQACYNPAHLYDGTYSSNLKDAYKSGAR